MTAACMTNAQTTNSRPDDAPRLEADFDSSELFAGRTEIRIAHADAIYRLRITRAGKLILNK